MHKPKTGQPPPRAGKADGNTPEPIYDEAFLVSLREAIREVTLHGIRELPSFRAFPYFPNEGDGPAGAPAGLGERVKGVQAVKRDVCKLLDKYARLLGAARRVGRKPETERDNYARELKAQGFSVKDITAKLKAEGINDVNGIPFTERAVGQALWRVAHRDYKPKPRARAYRKPGYVHPVAGQVPED